MLLGPEPSSHDHINYALWIKHPKSLVCIQDGEGVKNFLGSSKMEVMTSKNGSIWAIIGKSWCWAVGMCMGQMRQPKNPHSTILLKKINGTGSNIEILWHIIILTNRKWIFKITWCWFKFQHNRYNAKVSYQKKSAIHYTIQYMLPYKQTLLCNKYIQNLPIT